MSEPVPLWWPERLLQKYHLLSQRGPLRLLQLLLELTRGPHVVVDEHHVSVREEERMEVRDPHVVELPEQGEPLRQCHRRLQFRALPLKRALVPHVPPGRQGVVVVLEPQPLVRAVHLAPELAFTQEQRLVRPAERHEPLVEVLLPDVPPQVVE